MKGLEEVPVETSSRGWWNQLLPVILPSLVTSVVDPEPDPYSEYGSGSTHVQIE